MKKMKKKTRGTLTIIGAECLVALLFTGAILVLISKLNTGEALIFHRNASNIPVTGSIVILGILGIVFMAYLPGSIRREKNTSKAERKRQSKQRRMNTNKAGHQKSGMNYPWE